MKASILILLLLFFSSIFSQKKEISKPQFYKDGTKFLSFNKILILNNTLRLTQVDFTTSTTIPDDPKWRTATLWPNLDLFFTNDTTKNPNKVVGKILFSYCSCNGYNESTKKCPEKYIYFIVREYDLKLERRTRRANLIKALFGM